MGRIRVKMLVAVKIAMGWKLDEIDRSILEILNENARVSNEKLGKRVGLSEPAARRRVAALVARGVIRRFTIDIEESGEILALMFITTSPDAEPAKMAHALSEESGVWHVWELSGENDFALLFSATDMPTFNRRVDEIRAMHAIRKTSTSIIMKKWK